MSELMNARRRIIRRELLISVSVLAFFASMHDVGRAYAADADRATVWVELGAQLEQVNGFGDPYAPPFTPEIVTDGFTSPLELQRALGKSFGGESKVSFQPKNLDWFFSVSARYGRANGGTKTHEQMPGCPCKVHIGTYYPPTPVYLNPSAAGKKFSETQVSNSETHAILDFQAGKDIGLGLFGKTGESIFSFGVRFAQFSSKQIVGINANPDDVLPSNIKYAWHHHSYLVTSHVERGFRGLGPSLSWNASAPLLGNAEGGELALDWGANAAILFGREKMSGHHQTMAYYRKTNFFTGHSYSHFMRSANPARTKSLIVPNAGGFAGLSYRFANAKLNVGYRADYFFGAMDGGVDALRRKNVGFYGPFASVSVGLGG
jgi:hypothetical protein